MLHNGAIHKNARNATKFHVDTLPPKLRQAIVDATVQDQYLYERVLQKYNFEQTGWRDYLQGKQALTKCQPVLLPSSSAAQEEEIPQTKRAAGFIKPYSTECVYPDRIVRSTPMAIPEL